MTARTTAAEERRPLRIGFIGSGFIAHFHLKSLTGVRNVEVVGVYSPTPEKRAAFAASVAELDLGECTAHESLEALLADDRLDAVWILSPNHTRLETMEMIAAQVKAGRSGITAVACEKPLARTVAEARRMLALVEEAGLNHGYLENQLFSTAVVRGKEIIWRRAVPNSGRPYLARAAEEHSGPHEPWFWRGDMQGGGVLLDMMCHSVEVGRFMLTRPGAARDTLRFKSASATVATLKWAQPKYAADLKARMGGGVDYTKRPAEDFARGLLTFVDEDGQEVIVEATTSWAYVGPGLRIVIELLGPEYALEFSTLNTGLKVFMSREVTGDQGEDLVEKQNAEQGLMPVLEDEAGVYGYTDANRHMIECFRAGRTPMETFADGVAVIEMLMALYKSAEEGRVIEMADTDLTDYRPAVSRPQD
ncbi:Gfo/Idh/MocA family oxidoreductase [Arsenicitalea aurantiaca]|uniref:Gfo/Idh/MocA family oxidoreductase n=1 Tax=Arsenicitalea aurantiaca TaxID=1783274 RepID=A0A433XL79_9HYPH|nr:Gfo/Idh/MocA family oxidoreductase [Arsenicitalea aurantiaca]RUT34748.1 Gfo/Idh/MocA family oxidoreductase [Arsenicitalea aurantiaca]